MKRKLPAMVESAALSLVCTWGAVGCLISAFSLPVAVPNRIILVWACWTLLCCVLLPFRLGQAAVLTLGAAGAFWLWLEGSFGRQLVSILGMVAEIYDEAYGWGIPKGLRSERLNGDLALAVLGMVLIFGVSRTVIRRKGVAPAVLLLLLPLAACLLVTDTVPGELYLFALLLGLSLLLLTDSVRRESGPQAARLTATAVIPVALALGLLLHFCPQDGFVNTTGELRERILSSLMELPQKFQAQGTDWFSGLRKRETVELSALPSQMLLGIPVAEVTAEQSGPIYLRLQDYDVYTGTAWESTTGRQEALVGAGENRGRVTVTVLNAQGNPLLPSFPDGQTFLIGGAGENLEQRETWVNLRTAAMGPFPGEQWLKLPETGSAAIKALLQSIPGDKSTVEGTVQAVADYVSTSAAYDRSGTQMPTEAGDFAFWFLQQADRGYCVHFATAAAVLLRSAGIPARYVTGYRTDAQAGQTVQVTSDDAHAWVEYYDYRAWTWNILEVTPGDDSLPPVQEPTQLSTQPEPQTQPAAEPSGAQTMPQNTTVPQQAPQETRWQLPVWIPLTVFLLGLCCCLAELERLLRISLRRRGQTRGDNNRRAIACGKELRLLTGLLKRPVPEELEQLMEKALFSQHTLSREELNAFTACQAACRRALRKAPWWKRMVYRYWFAVI